MSVKTKNIGIFNDTWLSNSKFSKWLKRAHHK